ncbi:MAG TPA: glutamate--tRNA ligase family protein, partial [Verrucomicrobiae bacterium]
RALQAPHAADDEPIYPGTCRPAATPSVHHAAPKQNPRNRPATLKINWRFLVPDGQPIRFTDGNRGPQQFIAGRQFGDFVVWHHDDIPSYQLAVVVDDAAMKITEVVRGEDLLLSTARQLLLYSALRLDPPAFFHCPLVTDESGIRLAKRHDALSLRALRANGADPQQLRNQISS